MTVESQCQRPCVSWCGTVVCISRCRRPRLRWTSKATTIKSTRVYGNLHKTRCLRLTSLARCTCCSPTISRMVSYIEHSWHGGQQVKGKYCHHLDLAHRGWRLFHCRFWPAPHLCQAVSCCGRSTLPVHRVCLFNVESMTQQFARGCLDKTASPNWKEQWRDRYPRC